jgi:hypothetical protein
MVCTPRVPSSRAARVDAAGAVQLPRGGLILHASLPPNLPRFLCTYPFLTQFSRAVLEVFWYSKWVMQHIFENLSISTFQRYKVCVNRSPDERVMAPGSRGARAVFVCFPVKIPVKRGMPPANREWHIVDGVIIFPTHPGSQINLQRVGKTLRAKAAVWKKNASNLRPIFPRFLFVFARIFDLVPDIGFRRSWYHRKACAALFFKVLGSRETELGLEKYGPTSGGCRGVFGPLKDIFPIEILARPGKILAIREFHTVHECVFFPTCPGLRINLL